MEGIIGIIWLAIIVVMAIIEIITLGLTTIWFAGGALIAFIASLFGVSLPIQIVLFVIVSLVLLVFTRPFAVKFVNKNQTRTNAESLIGKSAIVLEDINNLKAEGAVSVNGQEWTARAVDDTVITKDTVVEIVEIKGVKLMVKAKI
ncbi:NfeD family protein [Roseburia sp. 499]|uniref:NfeD family protein n=1 Tax=Roseburia sp. 499 TaxID=1261634 RepID=UPI000953482B|nr:NfeD family protein [Roseburia sp. 499]